jgi:hypothetical protein
MRRKGASSYNEHIEQVEGRGGLGRKSRDRLDDGSGRKWQAVASRHTSSVVGS